MAETEAGHYVARSRFELRADALQAMREAVDSIATAGREPDRWESSCLTHSLSAYRAGTYQIAEVEADKARTPQAERSPTELSDDASAFLVTIAQLRHDLRLAEAEPLAEHDAMRW